MKRILFFISCFFIAFILVSCDENSGEKKITVKGAGDTEYESYQECCAVQDFMAAHQFLAKMEDKIDDDKIKKKEYQTAKEYVFKQEALYLMSIGDEAAKKRISYLLQEEGGNDSHVAMLIDLAIDNNDEDFVKVLVNHLKNPSGKCIAKVATYLIRNSDCSNNDYIITLVNGKLFKGTKPCTGLHDYYYVVSSEYEDYKKYVDNFNGICDMILDVAIYNKNKALALSILNLYKEDIGGMKGESNKAKAPDGTLVDGNHSFVWFFTKSKNDAQKKYTEAVKAGAFK